MNCAFDTLFDGKDEDGIPVQSEEFLRILRLNENKHRHLMSLILDDELNREAKGLCGFQKEMVEARLTWTIPSCDYVEAKDEGVHFFCSDELAIINLYKSRARKEGYLDEDYIDFITQGRTLPSFMVCLNPTMSRDKQFKQLKKWFQLWSKENPAIKRSGRIVSPKASLINLACWRLWRKSRWLKSDNTESEFARNVGIRINEMLPATERSKNMFEKREIARRCRRIWPLISERLKLIS